MHIMTNVATTHEYPTPISFESPFSPQSIEQKISDANIVLPKYLQIHPNVMLTQIVVVESYHRQEQAKS